MADKRSLSRVPADVGTKVRRLPVHFRAVWIVTHVLFLPWRAVWVGGFGVSATCTVGARASHTSEASLLSGKGRVKEVGSRRRPNYVPSTNTGPRRDNTVEVMELG